jgi:hypothetical protein
MIDSIGGRQRSSSVSSAFISQLAPSTSYVAITMAANTLVVSKFIAPVCTR